jgi:hypothetical protein
MSLAADPLAVSALPLAATALLWLASGVFLGRLFPFAPYWLAIALGGALACGAARTAGCTVAVAADIPVAAVAWYLTARGGRHAGRLAFRTAARRGAR